MTSTIELQKLGVVPQTVFLRTPESDGRPSRHRLNSEFTIRSPGTPRTHRTLSIDYGPTSAGAPFEDLRRRLALTGGKDRVNRLEFVWQFLRVLMQMGKKHNTRWGGSYIAIQVRLVVTNDSDKPLASRSAHTVPLYQRT